MTEANENAVKQSPPPPPKKHRAYKSKLGLKPMTLESEARYFARKNESESKSIAPPIMQETKREEIVEEGPQKTSTSQDIPAEDEPASDNKEDQEQSKSVE